MKLLKLAKSRRKNQTTDRIAIPVCTVRVEFTAFIPFGNV
jgi:hypothetical protein